MDLCIFCLESLLRYAMFGRDVFSRVFSRVLLCKIVFYIPTKSFKDTVEHGSKGPSQKGNPLLREIIKIPNDYYFYIDCKGVSVYGDNFASPIKSLEPMFN